MRRWLSIGSALLVLCSFCLTPTAIAADTDAEEAPKKKKTKKVGVWFPPNDFYPGYIADPLRPQNALTIQWLSDTEIPETTAHRFGLRLGGSFPIRRWHPEGEPHKGWQLTFEGGFSGQFDIGWSWDNTGWDGFYGVYLSRMVTPNFGFRIGSQHDSSHIGDEYSERTGIKRFKYTREEGIFGVSWRFRPHVTGYAEVGVGNGIAGSVTSRLQLGAQYISESRFWKGRASHFAAVDIRTYEETDWSTRLTVQAGYWIPVGDRSSAYRVAFEYGTGRSVLGQFIWYRETWFAIAWYYDF
jgi:hypothetical protein